MESQSLAALYATKTEEELQRLAEDLDQLTLEAQSALRNEMSRRKLSLATRAMVVGAGTPVQRLNTEVTTSHCVPVPPGSFMADVFRLYHAHLWLFFKLTAPALLFGALAILVARDSGREITRDARLTWQTHSLYLTMIEVWLVNTIGWAVSWTFFSFAFASICMAVRRIANSEQPSSMQAFQEVAPRISHFLRITLLLFVIFLVLVHFAEFFLLGPALRVMSRFSQYPFTPFILGVFFYMGIALIVSRFALAIPAVVLDNSGVVQSIFRSDALTEKKWTILTILLTKSILGGYVASMLPFWFGSWLLTSFHVTTVVWWFSYACTAASVASVSYVEPIMFIGFALLYIRSTENVAGNSPLTPSSPQLA